MSGPLLYLAEMRFEGEDAELVGVGRTAAGAGRLLDLHLSGMDAMTTGFAGPAVPGAMTGEVVDTYRTGNVLGYSLLRPVGPEKLTQGLRELLLSDVPMLPQPDLVRNVERALELLRRQPLHENDRLGAINLLSRGLERAAQAARLEASRREAGRREVAHLEVVK